MSEPDDHWTKRICAPFRTLAEYFSTRKGQLLARKGTMLNAWMKRGIWWACLGVGEYNFAPFKVVWEAYGKANFRPRIFG